MSTDAFGIKNGYGLTYGISKVIRNANAKAEVQGIHRHKYGDYGYYDDFFEIMLFIRGDSSFMIEGTTYALEPNDIMFAIPEEIHGIIHHSSCEYERYILRVTDDFFVINDLKPLYDCLKGKHFGEGNIIHHNSPINTVLVNLIKRIKNAPSTTDTAKDVINILTILAKRFSLVSSKRIPNPLLRQIILYINNHSNEEISLDSISREFFINKTYLAKIFKEYTNTTINQYIIAERLEKARLYHFHSKMSHNDAAIASGFKDYSTYYRAYKSKYGVSPNTMDSEQYYYI